MDQTVLVPILTILISLGSFGYAQWRAAQSDRRLQQMDDRAAAKDTVEALSMLNEAMSRNIDTLTERLKVLESEHKSCEERLLALTGIYQALLDRVGHNTP